MTDRETTEPQFIAQTAEPSDLADMHSWLRKRQDEAQLEGITFARISVDCADNPTMAIIEGWREQPTDQGEIRWQFTDCPRFGG